VLKQKAGLWKPGFLFMWWIQRIIYQRRLSHRRILNMRVPMSVSVSDIAREFSLTEEDLTKESLKAFLLERLRLLEAERQARCAKFGVNTLKEMDQLLQQGAVIEEDILEDFQEVDYLTTRIERVKVMIGELWCQT
jgi:hypothetical protein